MNMSENNYNNGNFNLINGDCKHDNIKNETTTNTISTNNNSNFSNNNSNADSIQNNGELAVNTIEFDANEIRQLIIKFVDPALRETVLQEISDRVNNLPQFAGLLWSAFGTVPALLSEIISLYPALECPNIIQSRWPRTSNTFKLLKGLASNPDTREHFARTYIPAYILPLLYKSDPSISLLEKLRLNVLEVIGNLLQSKESTVIETLLTTDIIPTCLQLVSNGSLLTKHCSLIILERLISTEQGLWYICRTRERLEHVTTTLNKFIITTKDTLRVNFKETIEMIKSVIHAYTRLLESEQGRLHLMNTLPTCLKEKPYIDLFYNEITTLLYQIRRH